MKSKKQLESKTVVSDDIILRQITDYINQCIQRIDDDIYYIVFLRKNPKIKIISNRFYLQQIDRFSRDVIVTFDNILRKNRRQNTLHSLILKIKDKSKRSKMEKTLDNLRGDAEVIINHRNQVVAHFETEYNSQLGDWYPAQPFAYFYVLNPCLCKRVLAKTEKLFWRLKSTLKIEGIGMLFVQGKEPKDIFKRSLLGAINDGARKSTLELYHKCRYKDCLLQES